MSGLMEGFLCRCRCNACAVISCIHVAFNEGADIVGALQVVRLKTYVGLKGSMKFVGRIFSLC